MENLKTETTLWPDYPLGIVSQGETVETFALFIPHSEGPLLN
ncbi:MAG: hypothetical protein ACREQP_08080 [Candidatus Binatia bacterium]